MLSYNIQKLVLEDRESGGIYTLRVGGTIEGNTIGYIFTVEDRAGNFTGYSLNTKSGERIAIVSSKYVIMAKYTKEEEK